MPRRASHYRCRGMTLLEVLVALAIFAIIAAAGYGGLQQGIAVQETLQQKQEFWRRLDSVLTLVALDLDQARNLPPRLPVWDTLAFRGSADAGAGEGGEIFKFTRGGHLSFREGQRSPYLRVAYRLREGTLYRVTWPQLDLPPELAGEESAIMNGIRDLEIRYLDVAREWRDRWPLSLNAGPVTAGLPRAVELTLHMDGETTYKRVLHVGPPR